MKRVVFTSNTSFSLYNFRLGLIRALKERGFEIIAIAPYDNYTSKLEKEFIYYPLKNLDRKGTNPVKDLRLFLEYLKYYRKIKPDFVINYTIKPNIYSSLACGILRIPCISVVTGLGYVFVRGGVLLRLVRLLYRLAFMFNKYIIVLNPDDLEVVYSFTKKNKIKTIRSEGVNTGFFSPEYCRESQKKEIPVFLYIGRFLKDKGIFELVEAGKKLWQEGAKFEIWLLGDIDKGNPASLGEEDITSIRKFEFVKIFPFAEDVRPYICLSDCVVLPSYYREGIPRSLLEAMAMGRPIIATDAPGCREVIKHGINGFLVAPKDANSLYLTLKHFLQLSEENRREMGRKGREIVLEEFDEKYVIQTYLNILNKAGLL